MKNLELERINRTMSAAHKNGLIEAYRTVFAEAPYFETYTHEEVEDMLRLHLDSGVVVVAKCSDLVIGFACAQRAFAASQDVQDFLEGAHASGKLPCGADAAWYLSELGVLAAHRLHGLGYSLTRECMRHIEGCGGEHVVTRTASIRSNSLHLFKRLGYAPFGEQDVSYTDQVVQNGSQSDHRVYLHANVRDGIRVADMILDQHASA